LIRSSLKNRARRGLDEFLGLLEAEAGDLADGLDNLDLVAAVALEHDAEGVLLVLDGGTFAGSGAGEGDGRGGCDAVLVLQLVLEFDKLEYCQAIYRGNDFVN